MFVKIEKKLWQKRVEKAKPPSVLFFETTQKFPLLASKFWGNNRPTSNKKIVFLIFRLELLYTTLTLVFITVTLVEHKILQVPVVVSLGKVVIALWRTED